MENKDLFMRKFLNGASINVYNSLRCSVNRHGHRFFSTLHNCDVHQVHLPLSLSPAHSCL